MGGGEGCFAGALAQGTPEMAGALPRQGEELLFAEADQRRFQEAGQVEIVLRQQHEARRRQQILDGELFAQVKAVDARHFDALALQRAHQGSDELVAPPHQHHEVAGMQQLALARALLLADQALGVGGDQMGEAFVRLRQRALRAFEVGRVGLGLRRADQRPQLDPAGFVLAARQMLDDMAGLDDALRRGIFTEYPIDRVEHGRGRAEGNIEVDRHEIVLGDAALFGEPFAHLLELARIGALEAEDRLLGVADGEHRAAALDRALAREEFLGQPADHLPLVGVGVLRLVDQHVVDAAVELVEHPGRTGRALQKAPRRHDQVVVVERRAPSLGAGIAAGDVEAEPQQRHGALDQRRAVDAVEYLRPAARPPCAARLRCPASPSIAALVASRARISRLAVKKALA